jgi:hypothetical protein
MWFDMKKVAVFYAYRNVEPFNSIRKEFFRPTKSIKNGFEFNTFFVEGRKMSKSESYFRDHIEKMRYSRLWALLRSYDKLLLAGSTKSSFEVSSENIRVDVADDLRHLAFKLYAAIEFAVESEFDFIVRTTMSSLINFTKVTEFLDIQENQNHFYGGMALILPNAPRMISGSFTILSIRTARQLLQNRRKHDYGRLDDVAFGYLLADKVKPTFLPSLNLPSMEQIQRNQLMLSQYAHFRCRTFSDPRNDLQLMLELQNRARVLGLELN